MTAAAQLMVDLSSNNPIPALKAHHAAGRRVLALKATEGTSYTWPEGATLAKLWHELDPDNVVWHYHFMRPGSGQTQADHFLQAVAGRWRDGDRIIADCEVAGVNAKNVTAFQHRCHSKRPDWPGGIYGSPYFLRDNRIRPHHGWILWLADYASSVALIPPGWAHVDAWQYTDRATGVPGVQGAVDQTRLEPHLVPHQAAKVKPRPGQLSHGHDKQVEKLEHDLNPRRGRVTGHSGRLLDQLTAVIRRLRRKK